MAAYFGETERGFAPDSVEAVFILDDIRQSQSSGWGRELLQGFDSFHLNRCSFIKIIMFLNPPLETITVLTISPERSRLFRGAIDTAIDNQAGIFPRLSGATCPDPVLSTGRAIPHCETNKQP